MANLEELKCRAINAATGKWVYGYPVPFSDSVSGWALVGNHFLTPDKGHIGTPEFEEVLNDTVCRFAGYTDYFNTPLFERDIIIVKPDLYGVIRYGKHASHISQEAKTGNGFYIEWLGERADIYRTDIGYWMDADRAVIRGNIFDNPELLEVKK